jgi:transglutaminase-like putative cysteine protease
VPGSPADGVTVRQHITLARLDGPFRPSADRPVRVTGPITAVDLQRLLAEANIRASTSGAERTRRLAGYLEQHRRNVRGAAVAGDVAAVRRFLGGGPGTSAQFAATFALAMRATGVPARLVVGFQPARAEATAVTGGDAWVWVELSYAGLGWQTYDVTPPAVTDRYTRS